MKCPLCQVDLAMSERQGVEVDYCPKCRGVWLDRGKLDKIIERSPEGTSAGRLPEAEDRNRDRRRNNLEEDGDERRGGVGGWLSNFFD